MRMRYFIMEVFVFASSLFACSQGPCTEVAVKEGHLPMAEQVFSFTPSFGKPVGSKAEFIDAAEQKLAGRTNIQHSWESDRRIVASTSGDMAYEHGTMDVTYDEGGIPHTTKVVMLDVYRAKGDVCERVAQTMHRLEKDER